MSKKITFIDNIGRNILGELVKNEGGVLSVKNPTVINIAQAENGQLQVQIIPLFLPEFIAETSRTSGTVWHYPVTSVTLCDDFDIDGRLLVQYDRIGNVPPQAPEGGEQVVKLFDQ